MALIDAQREETYEIRSSNRGAADPTGSGMVGAMSTTNLAKSALAHPEVRYRDRLLELDVYAMPGLATKDGSLGYEVHLYCPKCMNLLRVTSDRKQIHLDLAPGVDDHGMPLMRGVISIEPFQCTWEADPNGRRMEFGLGLCGWKVGIDNNIAKDA